MHRAIHHHFLPLITAAAVASFIGAVALVIHR